MFIRKPVFFLSFLTVLILAVLIGCASSGGAAGATSSHGNATGTATSTAQGFGGEISVTITMANGIITDVQVVGDAETPSIGSVAVMRAPDIIKRSNSADLDTISGSSITTMGIAEAAQAAIDKIVAGK